MRWFWMCSSGFKSHVLPESLSAAVIDDLQSRGMGSYTADEKEEVSIDLPGMIMVDRGWHTFDLDGFSLRIPCTDVGWFYVELKNLKERVADGKPYYKMHGWLVCVVFTPELREDMLIKMAKALPECEAIASAENDMFNKKIDKINKDGVKVVTKARPVKYPKVDA